MRLTKGAMSNLIANYKSVLKKMYANNSSQCRKRMAALMTCLVMAMAMPVGVEAESYVVNGSLGSDVSGTEYRTLALLKQNVTLQDGDTITFKNNDATLTTTVSFNGDSTLTLSAEGATDSKAKIGPQSAQTIAFITVGENQTFNLVVDSGSEITIEGFANAITGGNSNAIITIDTDTETDNGKIIFTGNTGNGAALRGNVVTINNGTNEFTSNNALNVGGAIYGINTVTISGGTNTFSSNSVTGGVGGAIYSNQNTGGVTISGGINTFTQNTASAGGAIASNGTITISGGINIFGGSQNIGNTADDDGGAIQATKGITISGGTNTFAYNKATVKNGGAISSALVNIDSGAVQNTFNNNSAQAAGGAIAGGEIEISAGKNDFDNNIAGTHGGAIAGGTHQDSSGNVTINGSALTSFTGNKSGTDGTTTGTTGSGGAIHGKDVSLENTGENTLNGGYHNQFINNASATKDTGGAIAATSDVSINSDNLFQKNQAGTSGGAISAGGTVTISGGKNVFGSTASDSSEGNKANDTGGAIVANGIIISSGENSFNYNTAGTHGGAIAGNTAGANGNVTISNGALTSFTGNKSGTIGPTGSGGAIHGKDVSLTNSSGDAQSNGGYHNQFISNASATADTGGAIAATGNVIINSNNLFQRNQAGVSGGAISAAGTVTIGSGKNLFDQNTATATANNGGAIYGSSGVIINGGDNAFTTNTAQNGGAIRSNVSVTINEGTNTFTSNVAGNASPSTGIGGNGGAIRAPIVQIDGGTNTFTTNKAYDSKPSTSDGLGGAIYAANYGFRNAILNITDGDNTFSGNEADHVGGAIGILDGTVTISGGTNNFSGNISNNNSGGAIGTATAMNPASTDLDVNITGGTNTFSGNKANDNGGAIAADIVKIDSATNNTFTSNLAGGTDVVSLSGGSGGAIIGGTVTIAGAGTNTFSSNQAADTGGAIASTGNVTISSNSLFQSNQAGTSGGAISAVGTVTISGGTNTFGSDASTGNKTGTTGGAIVANEIIISSGVNSFNYNTAGTHGGAIAGDTAGANGNVTISNGALTSFTGNKSGIATDGTTTSPTGSGGAIHGKDVSLTNSSGSASSNGGYHNQFINNASASADTGGAIAATNNVTIHSDNLFQKNQAGTSGGAISAVGTVTISGGTNVFGSTASDSSEGNKANDTGGAIVANEIIISSGENSFNYNTAGTHGGAIAGNTTGGANGNVTINGNAETTFQNNVVSGTSDPNEGTGGAIHGKDVLLGNTGVNTFKDNEATKHTGGAIAATGDITINTGDTVVSTFQTNKAGTGGGALSATTGTVAIKKGVNTFSGNIAGLGATNGSHSGGAIFAKKIDISGGTNTFENNNSYTHGGAIAGNTAGDGDVTINGSALTSFTGNKSGTNGATTGTTGSGGAIHGKDISLTNSSGDASSNGDYHNQFIDNASATKDTGGAIAATGNVSINSNNLFQTNTAGTGGGAISAVGTVTISGGTNVFVGNIAGHNNSDTSAKYSGGAIMANGDITISGGTTTFTGNVAHDQGGAIATKGTFSITGATVHFSGNLAKGDNEGQSSAVAAESISMTGDATLSGNGGFATDASIGTITFSNSTIAPEGIITLRSPSIIFENMQLKGENSGELAGNLIKIAGALTANIDDGKNVTISAPMTDENATSNKGNLVKNSAGTLTLSGGNSYSGGTTINAGKLVATKAGALGSGDVTNTGVLEFNLASADSGSFGNKITGTGSLVKTETGTLTLTNSTNDYSGGTTITEGELIATNVGALGSGNVINNDTLKFELATNGSYDKAISGTGSLKKSGAGTLTLNGNNTYQNDTFIETGRIDAGSDTAIGTGDVNMSNGTTLGFSGDYTIGNDIIIAQGGSVNFATDAADTEAGINGAISGGSFEKTGSGSLTINNASVQDAVLIGGNLQITGQLAVTGSFTAQPGSQLSIQANSDPSILADSVSLDENSTLNISGYNGTTLDDSHLVLISSNNVITEMSNQYTIANQPSADYMSAQVHLDDTKKNVVANLHLTWYDKHLDANSEYDKAHGTFTVDTAFELGKDLADRAAGEVFTSGWNGRELSKKGDGELILTGNNTYSGGTQIDAGKLTAQNVNALGTNGVIINDAGGVLEFNLTQEKSGVYANEISGDGSLSKTGAGTLTLNGDNTYGGGTNIGAGGIDVGSDTALATGDVNMSDETTLGFSGNYTIGNDIIIGAGDFVKFNTDATDTEAGIDGAISGGSFEKTGLGSLTINNASVQDAVLSEGTLQIGLNGKLEASESFEAKAGSKLSVQAIDGQAAIEAHSVSFEEGSFLNIDGYTGSKLGDSVVIISSETAITEMTNLYSISDQTTVDYLSAQVRLDDDKLNVLADIYLSWEDNHQDKDGKFDKAHGTFTIAGSGEYFELTSILADRAAGEVFTSGWNGKKLSKKGDGELILSGNNTYSGGTQIDAGKLTAQNVAALGTGAVLINDAKAVLGFDLTESEGGTFANEISGLGSLSKTGVGELTLSGENDYIGATVIDAGKIIAQNVNALGKGEVLINDAKASVEFDLTEDTSGTFANKISGLGSLSKTGGGDLTLAGVNDYEGGTQIDDGKLIVQNVAAMGSGVIQNDSLLELDLAEDKSGTFANKISGLGSLSKTGDGTLTLSVGNDYVGGTLIESGKLIVQDTAALGVGRVQNDSILEINLTPAQSNTFGNEISGLGLLSKTGGGTLTLSGDNSYEGGTNIDAGRVNVGSDTALGLGNVNMNDRTSLGFSGNYTIENEITIETGALAEINTETADTKAGINGKISGGSFEKTGLGSLDINNALVQDASLSEGFLHITGQLEATGSFAAQADTELSVQVNDAPTIVAGSVSLNENSILNISGYNGSNIGDNIVIISSQTVIDTMTNHYTIADQTTNDFISAQVRLDDTKKNVIADLHLTWYDNHHNDIGEFDKAHGTFTVDKLFELGMGLSDRGSDEVFTSGWDGKKLTKKGSGELILTGNNTYSGGTQIEDGKLTAQNVAALGTGDVAINNAAGVLEFSLTEDKSGAFANKISGSGSLGKSGGGTLTLTGENDYSGGTLIDGGKLSAQNVGALGAGAVVINNPESVLELDLTEDKSGTFANEISGSGILAKSGNGTLTLAGTNTYEGGTLIDAGKLITDTLYALGSGDIENNGILELNLSDGNSGDFGRKMSGEGSLIKTGDGNLTISNANDYSGGTLLDNGKLIAQNVSALGTGVVQNNSVLEFDLTQAQSGTFSNEMSGSGSVSKINGGTLTLTGTNTYTGGTSIDAGQITVKNTNALGTGEVKNNSILEFSLSAEQSGSFNNLISGSGQLFKSGDGELSITGDNTYTGGTNVSGGTIRVNGWGLGTGGVYVNNATLRGNGSFESLTLADSVIAPGNSIGTVEVHGDFELINSVYEAEIDSTGAHDMLIVYGTTKLSGDSILRIDTNAGFDATKKYTLIETTDNKVEGAFAQVDFPDLALLEGGYSVDEDGNIVLDFVKKDIVLMDEAKTANQKSVVNMLDNTPMDNKTVNFFYTSVGDLANVGSALDNLTGEIHPGTQTALAESTRHMKNAMLSRMTQPQTQAQTDNNFWVQAVRSWDSYEGNDSYKMDSRNFGVIVGMDKVNGNWRTGVAIGISDMKNNVNELNSSSNADSTHIGIYAGTTDYDKAYQLRFGADYSYHDVNARRSVRTDTAIYPTDNLSSKYNARTFQLFGEISSRKQTSERSYLEPFLGLAYTNTNTDDINESSSNNLGYAALKVAGQTRTTTASTLGLRLQNVSKDNKTNFKAMLSWRHLFSGDTAQTTNYLASGSAPYTIYGAPIAKDALLLDIGLERKLTDDSSIALNYTGQFANKAKSNTVALRLNLMY